MSVYKINQKTYTSNEGVNAYINTSLQPPEVSIFVKYRDFYLGKSILDIGCGAGRTSYYLRNFTKEYTGVDYSEAMIAYCKRQYSELTFEHCDARDLSRFSDNSFDFVLFSYNGIDYISNSDRLKVLNEIKRILKKDGIFMFSTHNRNYHNIITAPSLEFSFNPKHLLLNMINFIKQKKNNRHLKKEETNHHDYAILNDSGNNFSLLTYYITKEKQTEQLNDIDFKLIEMFDMDGQTLKPDSTDSADCWIYFVVQTT